MAKRRTDAEGQRSEIHSFVVRIWLEEVETGSRTVSWHGHITYVSNGERSYFQSLSEIPEFIQTHLHLGGGG